MTQTQTFYTFSTKGLNDTEIKFLAEVERLWLAGAKQSFQDLMMPAYLNCGYVKGGAEAADCLEAWSYWEFMKKPYDRKSYETPRKLSEVFTSLTEEPVLNMEYSDKRPKSFWIRQEDFPPLYGEPNMEYLNSIDDISLIYDFTPQHFHFKIVNDCLWLEYEQIIGSRLICVLQPL